jgi:hypothetical protein
MQTMGQHRRVHLAGWLVACVALAIAITVVPVVHVVAIDDAVGSAEKPVQGSAQPSLGDDGIAGPFSSDSSRSAADSATDDEPDEDVLPRKAPTKDDARSVQPLPKRPIILIPGLASSILRVAHLDEDSPCEGCVLTLRNVQTMGCRRCVFVAPCIEDLSRSMLPPRDPAAADWYPWEAARVITAAAVLVCKCVTGADTHTRRRDARLVPVARVTSAQFGVHGCPNRSSHMQHCTRISFQGIRCGVSGKCMGKSDASEHSAQLLYRLHVPPPRKFVRSRVRSAAR